MEGRWTPSPELCWGLGDAVPVYRFYLSLSERLSRIGKSAQRPALLPRDADVPDLERLMMRYADRPLDFADATLVHLAERESLSTIFTVDHDDFETYRIKGRGRFRIVPGR